MTRSSHKGELEYNPEIERTARRLRKEAKERKSRSSSRVNFEVDLTICGRSILYEEDEMADAERTLRELAAPDMNQQPLCITHPEIEVSFGLKSSLYSLTPYISW